MAASAERTAESFLVFQATRRALFPTVVSHFVYIRHTLGFIYGFLIVQSIFYNSIYYTLSILHTQWIILSASELFTTNSTSLVHCSRINKWIDSSHLYLISLFKSNDYRRIGRGFSKFFLRLSIRGSSGGTHYSSGTDPFSSFPHIDVERSIGRAMIWPLLLPFHLHRRYLGMWRYCGTPQMREEASKSALTSRKCAMKTPDNLSC